MSCWVAPKIAAEFWGLGLADIVNLIGDGHVPSCVDGGFQFVKLPRFSVVGQSLPPGERPSTFNLISNESHLEPKEPKDVVTPEERGALIGDDESEMGPPPDEDPNDNRIAGWREGRKRAGQMRRGPGRSGPANSRPTAT